MLCHGHLQIQVRQESLGPRRSICTNLAPIEDETRQQIARGFLAHATQTSSINCAMRFGRTSQKIRFPLSCSLPMVAAKLNSPSPLTLTDINLLGLRYHSKEICPSGSAVTVGISADNGRQ